MPIMAASDQNDARGSARVLANLVIKSIEGPRARDFNIAALNNLFRLLEAYRSHRFVGSEYEPRSARGPEVLTLLPPTERHVADLRRALSDALDVAYKGEHHEDALNSIENVLRSAAKKEPAREEERRRASAFLRAFVENLYQRHS